MYSVGGVIRRMTLDPNGERLAVIFEPQDQTTAAPVMNNKKKGMPPQPTGGSELIMMFMVRLSSWIGERRPLLQR